MFAVLAKKKEMQGCLVGGTVDINFSGKKSPQRVHGVGVLVSEFVNNVVEVEQINAQLMMVKLVIKKNLVNVISAYARQIHSFFIYDHHHYTRH